MVPAAAAVLPAASEPSVAAPLEKPIAPPSTTEVRAQPPSLAISNDLGLYMVAIQMRPAAQQALSVRAIVPEALKTPELRQAAELQPPCTLPCNAALPRGNALLTVFDTASHSMATTSAIIFEDSTVDFKFISRADVRARKWHNTKLGAVIGGVAGYVISMACFEESAATGHAINGREHLFVFDPIAALIGAVGGGAIGYLTSNRDDHDRAEVVVSPGLATPNGVQ